MKTPCLVTEGTSHPRCRDTARKRARSPNCIFHVPILGSGDVSLRAGFADLPGLFQAEVFCDFSSEGGSGGEPGRVSWQPGQSAGGFALCWIKPDLLILS